MAFWVDICANGDPFANVEVLQEVFDQTLERWQMNSSPCVPEIDQVEETGDRSTELHGLSASRAHFVAWVNDPIVDGMDGIGASG